MSMSDSSDEWTISADLILEAGGAVALLALGFGFASGVGRVLAFRSRRTVGGGAFLVVVDFLLTKMSGSGLLRFRGFGAAWDGLGRDVAVVVGLRAGRRGVFIAEPVPVR